jgi:hypothetical protein
MTSSVMMEKVVSIATVKSSTRECNEDLQR